MCPYGQEVIVHVDTQAFRGLVLFLRVSATMFLLAVGVPLLGMLFLWGICGLFGLHGVHIALTDLVPAWYALMVLTGIAAQDVVRRYPRVFEAFGIWGARQCAALIAGLVLASPVIVADGAFTVRSYAAYLVFFAGFSVYRRILRWFWRITCEAERAARVPKTDTAAVSALDV